MARPLERDGAVYQRQGTNFWWMRYRDRNGILRKESTGVKDWQAANKKLRERLHARDGNILEIVRRGEALNFGQWADFFLENYSKPPIREQKSSTSTPSKILPPSRVRRSQSRYGIGGQYHAVSLAA